jgi:hypothetical protein
MDKEKEELRALNEMLAKSERDKIIQKMQIEK